MLHAVKSVLKESMFVQKAYRRYVQPRLSSFEPETFILKGIKFDRCVDVGANAGIYSILFCNNSNRVYAFEPLQHSLQILRSLDLDNLEIYDVALGSQAGMADISLPLVDGEIDYSSPTMRSLAPNGHEKFEKVKIRVARFDDFESQIDFKRIEFVKMDVEGFEMQTLLGMSRLLALKQAALMIEIEGRHNPKYHEVFDLLGTLNYETYFTTDGVTLKRLDVASLPSLQTPEKFKTDSGRSFRLGDRKNYINNIFFLQPHHKAKFPIE